MRDYEELISIYDSAQERARDMLPLPSEVVTDQVQCPVFVGESIITDLKHSDLLENSTLNQGYIIFQFRKLRIDGLAVGWEL